jgi:hypothetical protein
MATRIFVFLFLSRYALAVTGIFTPSLTALGVAKIGTSFRNGMTLAKDSETNENGWPAVESPDHAIDQDVDKYLNFAEFNAGVIVITPNAVRPIQMTVWTANDWPERDPTSYEIYGTNATMTTTVGGAFCRCCAATCSSCDLSFA